MTLVQMTITIVACLMACGHILDRILTGAAKAAVHFWAQDSWHRLDEIGATSFVRSLSVSFARLFDFVYGSKVFSLRRVVGSAISTTIAMSAIVLVVGPSNTIFEDRGFFGVALIALFLNLVVDFVSLTETRLVLRWACTTRIPIVLLAVLDLALSLLIFYVGWLALYVFHPHFAVVAEFGYGLFSLAFQEFCRYGFDIRFGAGIFTLTTFFTSATWFAYVFCAALLRVAMATSRITKPLLAALSHTERPAQLICGILSCIVVLVAAVYFGVLQIVNTWW